MHVDKILVKVQCEQIHKAKAETGIVLNITGQDEYATELKGKLGP